MNATVHGKRSGIGGGGGWTNERGLVINDQIYRQVPIWCRIKIKKEYFTLRYFIGIMLSLRKMLQNELLIDWLLENLFTKFLNC